MLCWCVETHTSSGDYRFMLYKGIQRGASMGISTPNWMSVLNLYIIRMVG